MNVLTRVHFAARSLRRTPRYCIAAVSIIALSIGGVGGVFALIYGILLRPLPYPEPDRLVLLFERVPQLAHMVDAPYLPVNAMHFVEWRQRSSSFTEMALFTWHEETLSGTDIGVPAKVGVAWVWPSFLRTLGVFPHLGRDFDESESQPGKGGAVLLSNRFWREHFGAEPDAVGRRIVLDDRVYDIAGVLPARFRFPDTSRALPLLGDWESIDILRPFELKNRNPEGNFNWWAIGRLANGVDMSSAKAELDTLCAGISANWTVRADLLSVVRPLHTSIVGDSRKPLLLALGAVGLVLLIGCLNLSGLSLSLVRNRTGEIATHAAVGADPASLVGQFLTEGALLGLAGGCVGVALAAGVTILLQNWGPAELPLMESVSFNAPVTLVAVAATVLSVVLFSAAAARHIVSLPPQRRATWLESRKHRIKNRAACVGSLCGRAGWPERDASRPRWPPVPKLAECARPGPGLRYGRLCHRGDCSVHQEIRWVRWAGQCLQRDATGNRGHTGRRFRWARFSPAAGRGEQRIRYFRRRRS